MTLTQKLLARRARGLSHPWVQAGDVLRVAVDWTLASELAWNGMERTWDALGRPPPADPARVFLAVDHTVDPVALATDARTQRLVERARAFAREARLVHFHDANQTILHTRFYRDLVEPGQVVFGADSHTTSHGGLGAFAIGLGGADVVAAMVQGEGWLEVPEAVAVDFHGRLPFGISGKDLILEVLGLLGRNGVALERTVEFGGEGAAALSTDVRFTLCNMTAELGGVSGIFAADAQTAAWLATRARAGEGPRHAPPPAPLLALRADPDAPYRARHAVALDGLGPRVARPGSPADVVPLEAVAGTPVDGCFIGACTTTEEELVLAALVLEQALASGGAAHGGAALPPSRVRLVVPGDTGILARLGEAGLLDVYARAGFRVGPPGCSMCLGVASERARPGEVWLSSQNRNFPNRMGPGSRAFLSSAATVAASSLGLRLADPRPLLARVDPERYRRLCRRPALGPAPELRWAGQEEAPPRVDPGAAAGAARGGPSEASGPGALPRGGTAEGEGGAQGEGAVPAAPVRGRAQRFGDHVDTDAIIPGEFCHLTEPAELGARAFAHVRPDFAARVRAGASVVVAGEAWGTGSSREQAAWALLGAGVRAVVARSFAFIHKRNLVNAGLPFAVVEDPAFHALVEEGAEVEVDLARGEVRLPALGRSFPAAPPSPVVERLRAAGGLVALLRGGAA
jgi:aconitate hydratase/homoaconitate hydratase